MKLHIEHRYHRPSDSFVELVSSQLKWLQTSLQIDEARIVIEKRPESSPAFWISAHLITPGPDVQADATDHTLRAALQKLIDELWNRVDHRHLKRAQRTRSRQQVSPLHARMPQQHSHRS